MKLAKIISSYFRKLGSTEAILMSESVDVKTEQENWDFWKLRLVGLEWL